MLEIFLILAMIPIMAAKRGRRRRYTGRFVAIRVNGQMVLGTLADVTVIKQNLNSGASDNEWYAISLDLTIAVSALTAGEGPLIVGVCNSNLSVTQVKEALEADTTDFNSVDSQEASRRQVRDFGQFSGLNTNEVLFDGRPRRVKLKMKIFAGENVAIFIYNQAGGALTTGAAITWQGKMYGRIQ